MFPTTHGATLSKLHCRTNRILPTFFHMHLVLLGGTVLLLIFWMSLERIDVDHDSLLHSITHYHSFECWGLADFFCCLYCSFHKYVGKTI